MTVNSARQWLRKVNAGVMATTRPGTRQLVVYLASLLLMYMVMLLFYVLDVDAVIRYYILDGHDDFGIAVFPVHSIAEIVAFGPVLSLVMLRCFQKYIASCISTGTILSRKVIALQVMFVLSIALLNSGVITNRLFNIASAQAKAFYESTGFGWNNYVFAYYLDEIVG
nr:hypothetical protein [Candidatus Sigynarchaeota archaeon]